MSAPNDMPLPPCRVIDHDRVVDLRIEPLWRIATDTTLSPAPAIAALVPVTQDDVDRVLRQPRQVIWVIEKGALDRFLTDPKAHADIESGGPVLAVFADHDDYVRLFSLIPAAPLSQYEQQRIDEARSDEAAETWSEDDEGDWVDDDED